MMLVEAELARTYEWLLCQVAEVRQWRVKMRE